ncbi:MAG: WD40 repeat domain-containing protein [Caulobacteraceae bacterium]
MRQVAAIAFDAKGRRVAAATYGGLALWYARIAEQKPVMLRWAGSHIGLAFSPDGRFAVSSMQEAALHGWRLSDGGDMSMGGYPSKVASLAFVGGGAWLATSGASGVVLWPFAGSAGPMGKQAMEVGAVEDDLVTRVAGTTTGTRLAAGTRAGRVWMLDVKSERIDVLRRDGTAPISALAMLGESRVAWGDEVGAAGVVTLS